MKSCRFQIWRLLPLFIILSLLAGCAPAPAGPFASSSEAAGRNAAQVQADFDAYTDRLFLEEVAEDALTLHYTLADPAAAGVSEYEPSLGTVNTDDYRQNIEDTRAVLTELETVDTSLLREDQLLTYTILCSYLNTQLLSDGFELYEQPLSSSLGVQAQLPILLSEYTFYSRQDIEDYLALLASIDAYYASIITLEQQKTEAGLGLCDAAIDRIIESCNAYLLDADHSFMSTTFDERLNAVDGLGDQEKKDYAARNRAAINEHFVPAYQSLVDGLTPLKGSGGNDKGLSWLPKGKEYYEYLVRSTTGTSYSDIPALKKAMSSRMVDDLTAINELLTENASLAGEAAGCTFKLSDPQAILEDLKKQCEGSFPAVDGYTYSIKSVPAALEDVLNPAFYLTVPLDRPQDNSIYINNGSVDASSLYTTLAHEGYPGHMYQTLYFNRHSDCRLRKLLNFGSYTEGWATYAEHFAYGLDNGLPKGVGELLSHNASFTLGLYATLDVNIHYEGWNQTQVSTYLNSYFNLDDPEIASTIYYDIAENPANYLEYYVGYLEITNLQAEARRLLGTSYSDLEFNRFLLDLGPAPFGVIRAYFNEWVKQQNGRS